MNWPNELIIKRDKKNIKVINRNDIIKFIDRYCDLEILEKYLSALKSQDKVAYEEVSELIKATEERIDIIKKYTEAYESCKSNNDTLVDFFEKNFNFFREIIDTYIV